MTYRDFALLLVAATAILQLPAPASAQTPQARSAEARAYDARRADRRAAETERKMTDAERFQLLHSIMPVTIPGIVTAPEGLKIAAGWIKGVPRLGLPDIYESDASLGIANPFFARKNDSATALPSGLLLASTFDPTLAERSGAVVGAEARSRGFSVLLGGGVNLTRDPRNGRNFEYLGEDPLLAGRMVGGSIRGIQSQNVVSTIKHFALNALETSRMQLDARIEEAALRESDLLAFELGIEEGQPGAVMCAYNKVNGDYACGNDFLLNQVLKTDWNYRGWVMADWGATRDVSYFNAGLDQQSGAQADKQVWFDKPLYAEYQAGRVSKARVSDAVRRILRSLYAVGADTAAPTPVDMAAHGREVRAVAESGIVLLKNEGELLPLSGSARTIAIIGGHADVGVMSGGGSSQVVPPGEATFVHLGGRDPWGKWVRKVIMPSSPLKELRKALPDAKIEFDPGYVPAAAAGMAKRADVAIVFATQWQSEGLDGSLTLPEGQDALIAAVAAANPNTVVVLETGNPVKMPWISSVKAVVEAWYPGQEGGTAIANVLSGKVNPSGRLPISFPIDESQLAHPVIEDIGGTGERPVTVTYDEGADVGYRRFAATKAKPLFAFGHGLSYTRFSYSGLRVTAGKAPAATVTVSNDGPRDGATVVQVYLTSVGDQPRRRLVGFGKVQLSAGERRQVTLPIDRRLLAQWGQKGWRMSAGDYGFATGQSALDLGESVTTRFNHAELGR
ncbi:glycoside hydrolase family 3 C-terminal domain-containing protein [Caulobacter sp. CCNWLY153]|uniref:beta-glucosidase n=1 Tax=unclassified Caulobacter TaxID=2648921 RepID=UPI002FF12CF0